MQSFHVRNAEDRIIGTIDAADLAAAQQMASFVYSEPVSVVPTFSSYVVKIV